MDLFATPLRETASVSESFSDLPGSLREKIDAVEDFDLLETTQFFQAPLLKDDQSSPDPLSYFVDSEITNKLIGNSSPFHQKYIPKINLENIIEEQSCELDNSRATEFNRSTKDNFYSNDGCYLPRDHSSISFLKNRQLKPGELSFNAKADIPDVRQNFSMRDAITEEIDCNPEECLLGIDSQNTKQAQKFLEFEQDEINIYQPARRKSSLQGQTANPTKTIGRELEVRNSSLEEASIYRSSENLIAIDPAFLNSREIDKLLKKSHQVSECTTTSTLQQIDPESCKPHKFSFDPSIESKPAKEYPTLTKSKPSLKLSVRTNLSKNIYTDSANSSTLLKSKHIAKPIRPVMMNNRLDFTKKANPISDQANIYLRRYSNNSSKNSQHNLRSTPDHQRNFLGTKDRSILSHTKLKKLESILKTKNDRDQKSIKDGSFSKECKHLKM